MNVAESVFSSPQQPEAVYICNISIKYKLNTYFCNLICNYSFQLRVLSLYVTKAAYTAYMFHRYTYFCFHITARYRPYRMKHACPDAPANYL
jgi:hypothetical protein